MRRRKLVASLLTPPLYGPSPSFFCVNTASLPIRAHHATPLSFQPVLIFRSKDNAPLGDNHLIRLEVLRNGDACDLNIKVPGSAIEALADVMLIQSKMYHVVTLGTSPGATTVPMSVVGCNAANSFDPTQISIVLGNVATNLVDVESRIKAGKSFLVDFLLRPLAWSLLHVTRHLFIISFVGPSGIASAAPSGSSKLACITPHVQRTTVHFPAHIYLLTLFTFHVFVI